MIDALPHPRNLKLLPKLLSVDFCVIEQERMVLKTGLTPSFVASFIRTTQRKPASTDLLQKRATFTGLMKEMLLNGYREQIMQDVR